MGQLVSEMAGMFWAVERMKRGVNRACWGLMVKAIGWSVGLKRAILNAMQTEVETLFRFSRAFVFGGGESGSVIGLYLWRYSTQLELLQFLQMAFKGSARKFDFSNPYTRLTFNSFQSHAESHKL